MHRHLVRRARLLGSLAATVALLAGTASVALGQSAAPSGSATLVEPWLTVDAGTCDPGFPGLCSTVEVAQWPSIPYTPPVNCSLPGADVTCPQLMDISAPTSGGPWPIVVALWGGPVAQNGQVGQPDPVTAALAGQGAVVMASGWRQADYLGGGYPTSFEDAACAIGVARAIGPAYGGDPDRVTLLGYSLGGWPAAVLGLTPTPFTPAPDSCDATAGSLHPDAVVSIDGAIDEPTLVRTDDAYILGFMGGDEATDPEAWAAAAPFTLVERYPAGADAIPFLLINGEIDPFIPPKVPEDFHSALAAAGYDSRLLIIPGAGHVEALFAKDAIDAVIDIATGK